MSPLAGESSRPRLCLRHKDVASKTVTHQGYLGFTKLFMMSRLKHKQPPARSFNINVASEREGGGTVRIATCPNHAFPTSSPRQTYPPFSNHNFSGSFAAPADVIKHIKGGGTHPTQRSQRCLRRPCGAGMADLIDGRAWGKALKDGLRMDSAPLHNAGVARGACHRNGRLGLRSTALRAETTANGRGVRG